jgi:hypothetical protein
VFKNNYGKLMVYAATGAPQRKRLESVRTATQETARRLNLDFGLVKFKEKAQQIYVYYENGEDEPVPIYCDEGKRYDLEGICASLRKMMFVLSFHPKNSALKRMRSEIIRLS